MKDSEKKKKSVGEMKYQEGSLFCKKKKKKKKKKKQGN